MTLTMKRLPQDSFLPTGAILDPNEHVLSYAGLVNGHPSQFISPLALPHAANKLSYFEDPQLAALPPSNYKHPTAGGGEAQFPPQRRYFSPHQSPPDARHQPSVSISPSRYQNSQSHIQVVGSGIISPSLAPLNDPAITTSAAHQLRRVSLQNRRLLENWEAERAHLEANRARAEEIYKEERAIMDEERLVWAEERTNLLARVTALEQEKTELLGRISQLQGTEPGGEATSKAAHDSAISGIRGGSSTSPDRLNSPTSSGVPTVKFRPPSDGTSPPVNIGLGQGHTMPESHPFVPLDPRMQSGSPPNSSPEAEMPDKEPAPPIDVQVIHPDLEGIPIKARAVQKATFTDGKAASPMSSKKSTPSGSNQGSPTGRTKASPAELTKEALKAPESHRLKMHAGHTPNHSLSHFATVVSTEAPNTAGSSGTTTPNHEHTQRSQVKQDVTHSGDAKGKSIDRAHNVSDDPNLDGQLGAAEENARPHLEPSEEDPELKGPLMLRNMPAHDEPFLRRLSDKLEDSLKTDNATPTVLKNGHDDETDSGPVEDIPLKFKNNNNFGAPLGALSSKTGA